VALLLPLSASVSYAATSIDVFTVNSAKGGFLLNGGSLLFGDSTSTFTVTPHADGISLRAFTLGGDDWSAIITPPTGTALQLGTFPTLNVEDATHAGLMMAGNGHGCGGDPGSITISELTRDPDTQAVTAFAASYQFLCDLQPPQVSGELRYHSSIDYVAASTSAKGMIFGTLPVGTSSAPQTISVRSDGTIPLQLGASTIGDLPGAYEVTSDGCAGQTLAFGQTCSVSVVAHPTASGEQDGTLLIPDNTVAGNRRVWLTTAGGFPDVNVSFDPPVVDFGAAIGGVQSPPRMVTVTSTGTAPIVFGTATIATGDPSAFGKTTDTCSGATLAPGQQCTVSLYAQPTALFAQSSELLLPDNGVGGSHSVQLKVLGINSVAGRYYPLPPTRVLDTRSGLGATKAQLPAGGVLHLQLTGAGGVAASGVSAVVLNVTVTGPTAASYLAVYPSGAARPTVSNLNFPKGWTGANNVTVPVGTGGQVDIYNLAGSTDVIADVLGFYAGTEDVYASNGIGGEYQPTVPQRLLDTRSPFVGAPLGGHSFLGVAVDYGADLNQHVRALALNVTAVNPKANGFLTTWSGAGAAPTASTLNFTPGAVVANMAIVPVAPCTIGPACAGLPGIAVYNGSGAATDVIVDIFGVFDDSNLGGGLLFRPVTPTRIVDSRIGLGTPVPLGPKITATVTTPGSVADIDAFALAANVTAVAPTASTYLSVWPAIDGFPQPVVSTVNAKAKQIVPNAALITIGPDFGFNIFNFAGTTNVLVDVAGVFDFDGNFGAAAAAGHRDTLTYPYPSHLVNTGSVRADR
jgi:hypothetical protein